MHYIKVCIDFVNRCYVHRLASIIIVVGVKLTICQGAQVSNYIQKKHDGIDASSNGKRSELGRISIIHALDYRQRYSPGTSQIKTQRMIRVYK